MWETCTLPPGKQALPSRMLLSRKRPQEGDSGRYKARLVAGGHRQQHGVDYDETFASVASYRTLRMMFAVAAHEGLVLRQFDICTAFLHGELTEEVYLRPPRGLQHIAGGEHRVLKLRRALYGLKQASRAWAKRLEQELRALGFVQSDADPSLWILYGEGGARLAMFYVDDGMIAARTAKAADELVDRIAAIFPIRREHGDPQDMLGIEIQRDWGAGTIKIDQRRKALAIAVAAGVAGESRSLPMRPAVYGALRKALDADPRADKEMYQSVLGKLMHLAQCTRPDIALPVAALAAYGSDPTTSHMSALLDVTRYVGSTAGRGITFGGVQRPVTVWCDSNFAACMDTRRSTTGWVVTMYGGAVSWQSKKQATTATSTMEAEYQACGSVAREALSLTKGLGELAHMSSDFPLKGALEIRCDNQAALTLCKDKKEGQRMKHIDIVHHFVANRVSLILRHARCHVPNMTK